MNECQWKPHRNGVQCKNCGRIKKRASRRICRKNEMTKSHGNKGEGWVGKSNQGLKKDPISMVKRYGKARTQWKKAGKPMRDKKEVARIFDEICSPCEYFNQTSCAICGCRIKREGTTLNKLAWKTEKCADTPPRWGDNEEVISDDIELESVESEKIIEKKSEVGLPIYENNTDEIEDFIRENVAKGGSADVLPVSKRKKPH